MMHNKKYRVVLLTILMFCLMSVRVFAADTSVLDGILTISNVNGSISSSSTNSYVIQAEGGLLGCETVTLTITNKSGANATLEFDYIVEGNYGSFKVNGSSANASGHYSGVLGSGSSITVVVAGKRSYGAGKATLKLSNLSLVSVKETSTVELGTFDSNLGSVEINDEEASAGDTASGNLDTPVKLTATAKSGVSFLGWVNAETGQILEVTDNKYYPTADITVKPVFMGASSSGIYALGGATQYSESMGTLGIGGKLYYYTIGSYTHLFDDLNEAATTAENSTSKYIVLLNDATLPAGEYTIPSGVTLLIPFDTSNTMYTTQAQASSATYATPTAYRTLTMAEGAKITIDGAVSVSGKHRYAQGSSTKNIYGGAPIGEVAFVDMESNSSIEINKGGALYVYGFITGAGSVTANSGAVVYENFQITDFRGGEQSTAMENKVFPVSQYYVQNIEVPLTLYSGAAEYGYTTVYASSAQWGSGSSFIGTVGSDAMFQIASGGYVTKRYDGTTDRLRVEASGGMTLSSISLKLSSADVNSATYVLPINGNISITIKSGSTASIDQDIAMIPGSELIVEENATVTLASEKSVYVYDEDTWQENFCHGPRAFAAVPYAPSRTYTRTTADLVDASILVNGTIDASAGYFYTTSSGANIHSTTDAPGTVKITPGTDEVTYQLENNSTYVDISITSARLKNRDESYTETAGASTTTTYYYCSTCGYWVTHKTAVATIIGDSSAREDYHSLSEAVVAYNETGYIQMLLDSVDAVSISGTVYLDLNGCDVSGVTLSGTLYGADSSSDGFAVPGGSITVSGSTVAAAASINDKDYVAHYDSAGGTYSFHRFAITPVACRFYLNSTTKPTHSHLAFKAALQGDDIAIGEIDNLGFVVNGTEFWYGKAPVYTDLTADEEFASYKTISVVAVDYEGTGEFGTEYKITAKAKFDDKTISSDETPAVSMTSALEQAGIAIG